MKEINLALFITCVIQFLCIFFSDWNMKLRSKLRFKETAENINDIITLFFPIIFSLDQNIQ
jgi:peptidoglycan biosynthesis protein MviN/MurJ (putative lipid II flippase)